MSNLAQLRADAQLADEIFEKTLTAKFPYLLIGQAILQRFGHG